MLLSCRTTSVKIDLPKAADGRPARPFRWRLLLLKGLAMQMELFPGDKEYSLSEALLERYRQQADENADNKEYDVHWTTNDLTGQRFGRLLVIEMTNKRFHGGVVYMVECSCGVRLEMSHYYLRRSTHCGCRRGHPGTAGINWAKQPKPSETVARRHLFATYRNSATRRGYHFELTYEQFEVLTTAPCCYCGDEPRQVETDRHHTCVYNGIDRLDSDGHYTLDNCVSCCGACNRAKGTQSVEEFNAWIERLVAYRRKNNDNERRTATTL